MKSCEYNFFCSRFVLTVMRGGVCACLHVCMNGCLWLYKCKKWGKHEICRTIYFWEIVNAKELFCQLRDCDDEFDGYNHYTISFFSTFTSLEFFLLNGNVHVHQENVFEEEIMNKEY